MSQEPCTRMKRLTKRTVAPPLLPYQDKKVQAHPAVAASTLTLKVLIAVAALLTQACLRGFTPAVAAATAAAVQPALLLPQQLKPTRCWPVLEEPAALGNLSFQRAQSLLTSSQLLLLLLLRGPISQEEASTQRQALLATAVVLAKRRLKCCKSWPRIAKGWSCGTRNNL